MRTFLVVVLSSLGGLLLLTGGTVATLVGPDDTASLPSDEIPAASGVAITSFDLFGVRDLTLHVSATSQDGPVFLGTAHPVDARDYVKGVDASWVQGVDRSGALTTDVIEGELDAPEVDPTTVSFWYGSTSGAGTQELAVRLSDDPVTFVVAPLGGPATTTLAFGVVVPRLFVAAVGTALTGALLIASAVLVRLRGRRGSATSASGGSDATGTADEAAPLHEAAATRSGAGSLQRRALVLGAGLSVGLTACVPLPSAVEHADEPVRLAVTEDELDAALESYGERKTAASGLAAQLDATGWADPDTDGLLALVEYRTKLAAARNEPPAASTVSYIPVDAAVPEFTSYPMWFLALVDPTTDGTPGDLPQLRVFERERATAPWRASLALDVPEDAVTLPAPGAASTATPDQVAAGLAGLELVRSHLETGAEVGVELGDLQTFREDVLGDDLEGRLVVDHAQVSYFEAPEDPTAPGGPVQVVPVDGGVLVTAALTYVFNQRMEAGWTVTVTDQAVAQVMGQTGDRQNVRTVGLAQAVLLVPQDGAPRVLSASSSLVAPRA